VQLEFVDAQNPTTDLFPEGAGLNELPPEAMAEIILSYYPKADQETVARLSTRYNNPYPSGASARFNNVYDESHLE